MGWVHWWDIARLHEGLGYQSPPEVEPACTGAEAAATAVL